MKGKEELNGGVSFFRPFNSNQTGSPMCPSGLGSCMNRWFEDGRSRVSPPSRPRIWSEELEMKLKSFLNSFVRELSVNPLFRTWNNEVYLLFVRTDKPSFNKKK